jgi:thioredoxin 2
MSSDSIIVACPRCGAKNRIPVNRQGDRPICGKCRSPLPVGGSSPAKPVDVTDRTFNREVIQHTGPALLDCWAPWCGPCRMVAPVLEQLAREYAGKIKIAKLNTDENQQIARQYGIQSIPTLLFFKAGQLVKRQAGALPKHEIERLIRAVI